MSSYIEQVREAIADSESAGRLKTLDGVTGLSGDKLIGSLQRFAALNPTAAYVEVGVFRGLTLTSVAAAAPSTPCYGIDDFSQFDPGGLNKSLVEERIGLHTSGNAHLINADFEDALLMLEQYLQGASIGTYFVDGPHDYRSQYISLDFARHAFAEHCVIVVDDANYEHIRRANSDWLRANPEFALIHEAYTSRHPETMPDAERREAVAGWWNGVNIMVRDPGFRIERCFPPLSASRDLYLNEHTVHPAKYARLAPKLVSAMEDLLPIAALRLFRLLLLRDRLVGRYSGVGVGGPLPASHLVPFARRQSA